MKRTIRLTESDLKRMIKESVSKILNEFGETERGQKALGALAARKKLAHQPISKIDKYAEKARGGDNWDVLSYPNGTIEGVNPLYPAYANGYKEYLDSHPDEHTSYHKTKHLHESYNNVECIEDEINISDTNGSDILFDYLYENNITDDIVSVKVYVDNEPYDAGDYYTPPSGGASYSHCEVDVDGKFKRILPDEIYSELVSAVEEYIDRHSDDYAEQVEDNNEWDPRDEYDPDDY
jgi:hypothetical protein